MLALNLLSPQEKMESSLKWHYLIIKNVILWILILTAVISAVLLGAKLILVSKLDEAKKQAQLVKMEHVDINKKISSINKQVLQINNIQKEFIPWSDMLFQLNQLIPEGIAVSNMELDLPTEKITIKGDADRRETLLALKDAFEKSPLIRSVNIPLEYLLKKYDISFTLTAESIIPSLYPDEKK